MKKSMFIGAACLMLAACENTEWEYTVVRVTGDNAGEYLPMSYSNPTSMLNNMGKDGWELIDTYTETNTAFPNFGNEQYVTGLQPNTRTAAVNFVFKRKLETNKKEEDTTITFP